MRRKLFYLLVLTLILGQSAFAGIPKILLVGDSWPWFMMLNQAFTTALDEEGLGQYEALGMNTTAPGSTAKQWRRERWLKVIQRELDANPSIDIVHVSLGGNDYLSRWSPKMPIEDRTALFEEVRDNIEAVVKAILDMRPDIRVAIVEYDYVNATRKGSTIPELNKAGQILAHMKMEMSKKYPRCGYIQTYGLMQYTFGFPPDVAPHTVPMPGQAPDFTPFPGGNTELGSPAVAMMDDIHCSPKGYHVVARHCIDVLYRDWIEHPLPKP